MKWTDGDTMTTEELKADRKSERHLAMLCSGILVLFLLAWIGKSYFEAAAYNRLTGSSVSTWDAMFVELRVQEAVKP